MRLPMDFSQWGMLILQALTQKIPALEPHIQLAQLIEATPEGDGHGVVPLTNGFVPFVVRGFDLKPLDVLILVENGEQRFTNLSEANAVMAVGGLTMGQPIEKMPPGVPTDQEVSMTPPYNQQFGFGRRGRPDVHSQILPVKLGSADPQVVADFIKLAGLVDPELPVYLATHYAAELTALVSKKASAEDPQPTTLVFEPQGGKVDVIKDGEKVASLAAHEAAEVLRRKDPEATTKVAALMRDELVIYSNVPTEKRAYQTAGEKRDTFPRRIRDAGWYTIGKRLARVFKTTRLDGTPTAYLLAVCPEGHRFNLHIAGVSAVAPHNEELKNFLRPSHLVRGELCFILNEKTGEATIPFRVEGSTVLPGGEVKLIVSPLLGSTPNTTVHFGNNQHPYKMGHDEVALPKTGHSVFVINPDEVALHTAATTRVVIHKGGGTYALQEDGRHPVHNLTRGQVVSTLMHQYGMEAAHALDYMRQVDSHVAEPFYATHTPETRIPSRGLNKEAAEFAAVLWSFTKRAADIATETEDLDPKKSGPNRGQEAPGVSGPNSALGTTPNMGAGVMPDIPHLKEVADTITSYAMGQFAPEELSEVYTQLIDKLGDVADLVGRVITLIRLGKVSFITEQEAKRLLDESDKFRATLTNADMLLKGVTATV